jgi:hypothetical protein
MSKRVVLSCLSVTVAIMLLYPSLLPVTRNWVS